MIFEIDYSKFAKAVEAKRKAEGLSLRDAALEIGMNHATLFRAESGYAIKAHHFITLLYWMKTNVEQFRKR